MSDIRSRLNIGVDMADEISDLKQGHNNHETRIETLESIVVDIAQLAKTAEFTLKYVKRWTPVIGTAIVSSGVASGKLGEFFAAFISALY